jgi:hypothetical protein
MRVPPPDEDARLARATPGRREFLKEDLTEIVRRGAYQGELRESRLDDTRVGIDAEKTEIVDVEIFDTRIEN